MGTSIGPIVGYRMLGIVGGHEIIGVAQKKKKKREREGGREIEREGKKRKREKVKSGLRRLHRPAPPAKSAGRVVDATKASPGQNSPGWKSLSLPLYYGIRHNLLPRVVSVLPLTKMTYGSVALGRATRRVWSIASQGCAHAITHCWESRI